MYNSDHVVNPVLLDTVRQKLGGFQKQAFIPSGDPSMGGGGAPPAGGGGGGQLPMDPAAMGGGGGGGAPPPPAGGDPSGGGGGGAGLDAIMQKLNQLSMGMQAGGAGGAAGGAGGLKPKIDQNMVSVQILKTLARICDHLGIHVPMSDMVPGMGDLNQLAAATQGQAPMPGAGGGDPAAAGAGGAGGGAAAGGGAIGGVGPVDPMQGAGTPGAAKTGSYRPNGSAFDTSGLVETSDRASMILQLRRAKGAA